MSSALEKGRLAFKEEAEDLLKVMEEGLLELEDNPADEAQVHNIFRALHTIKGSGAMFGFTELSDFAHHIETAFDQVRSGALGVTEQLIALGLKAHDQIQEFLVDEGDLSAEGQQRALEVDQLLRGLMEQPAPAPQAPQATADPSAQERPEAKGEGMFWVRFAPQEDFFLGYKPLALLRELKELEEVEVFPQVEGIPHLEELDPEVCYTSWEVLVFSPQGIQPLKDVFMFVEQACRLEIQPIQLDEEQDVESVTQLGQILAQRGAVTSVELEKLLRAQPKVGELLTQSGLVSDLQVQSALSEQKMIRSKQKKKEKERDQSSIRVPSQRLDALVDLVGELTTMQAHISQIVQSRDDPALDNMAEGLTRLAAELREATMELRMLPIGTAYSKFKRLVRDLSQELGKEVELITEGETTELDKTLIERLNDPLVHLIRNAIDHGVERPEQRKKVGKPSQGKVSLSAIHSGTNIILRVADDGAGIHKEKVIAKAKQQGLIEPDASLSDSEAYALLFHPGFSTAEKVTSVSGRGVGMDVVRQNIESLRGKIAVESEWGRGTTFVLHLPLTLTMIEGLLVRVADCFYVFPLATVEECVAIHSKEVRSVNGTLTIKVRGEVLPFVRLRNLFQLGGEPPELEQIVIARVENSLVGFSIDLVIGEHQSVIKPLTPTIAGKGRFSGTTLLGDGTVALVLNLFELVGV